MSENFTELPVYNGVGPWHFNRYRVAFHRPAGQTKQSLAADFRSHFVGYFASGYATVYSGNRNYQSLPTLKFHGFLKDINFFNRLDVKTPFGIDLGFPHHDWVAQIDHNDDLGFTAQTLKREFFDPFDDVTTAAPVTLVGGDSPVEAAAVAYLLVELNRMHFLAGRRSWRIDDGKSFGIPGDLLALETIAVERFSHQFFMLFDTVIGLESHIPHIWIALLDNFVKQRKLVPHAQPELRMPPWNLDKATQVYWYRKYYKHLTELTYDPEFKQESSQKLYKTILP